MDYKTFYDSVRDSITLTTQNVRGFDFIIGRGLSEGMPLDYMAYILATTFHETAHTMQPIAEYGKGRGRKYGVKGKYGQVPYGRGYVQLTWDFNYEKADKKLGLKGALLKDFDLAMDPEYAVRILFTGMLEGWFTNKKLSDYIDGIDEDDQEDLREFSNARYIINGKDKRVIIGQLAITFEHALRASGYGLESTEKPTESVPEEKAPTLPEPEKPSVEAPEKADGLFVLFLKLIQNILRGK